jgi:FtsH-binding integral membrane protein
LRSTGLEGASRITGNREDAEEVVQDALWAVVRKIGTFRGEAAFGSWLYRIVSNAAYQKLRAQRRRQGDLSLDQLLPFFEEIGRVPPTAAWSPRVDNPAVHAEMPNSGALWRTNGLVRHPKRTGATRSTLLGEGCACRAHGRLGLEHTARNSVSAVAISGELQGGKKMADFEMTPVSTSPVTLAAAERVTAFLRKVYGWMFAGLGVTAVVAFTVAGSPAMVQMIASNHILFLGLVLGELGLVFYLSGRAPQLAPNVAVGLFVLYSALNGVTLSLILLMYTGASIATTFVVTAGMFGALALFGSTTKRSLAGAGQFFFMGLIGVVLASVVGIFWHSAALQFLISVVGVLVFTGLTAWDAQRLKQMALTIPDSQSGSYAIVGALSLYLNFLNLFLILLRFQGGSRD